MENRSAGIIATLIAVLLCGCPGLVGVCAGLMAALLSFVPGAEVDIFGSNDPRAALTAGVIMFVVGLIFVAIPIAVWLYVRRTQPAAIATVPGQAVSPPPPAEPVEPAARAEAFRPTEAPAPRPKPEPETGEPGAQVFPREVPPEERREPEEKPGPEGDEPSDEEIPPAI